MIAIGSAASAVTFMIVGAAAGNGKLTWLSASIFETPVPISLAVAGVAYWSRQKYLREELDQDKLEAYLTKVKKKADRIHQQCWGSYPRKAAVAAEISRQLSELPELVK